jgi:N-acetylglucosamine kinase-like BadF-type ATPase
VRKFLGIDGGGTKTEFVLIDESGQVLSVWREGCAYYIETGIDELQAMLLRGIRQTLSQAAIAPAEIASAFVGFPAYGEDSRMLVRLDQIAAAVLPSTPHRCGNDMICGWAGALAGSDGINIVAGTGSIAYGEFESRSARAGGWGELFGDEGSAYWIAREALALFSRMSDGRETRGALYDLVRAHFGLHADLDVCATVYGPPALSRSALAALAPLAAQAAGAGDLAAARLFDLAAKELAAMVHAVRDRLDIPAQRCVSVAYSGGLFHAYTSLSARLRSNLESTGRKYAFVAPRLSPSAGAALYAARCTDTPLSAVAIEHLVDDMARRK